MKLAIINIHRDHALYDQNSRSRHAWIAGPEVGVFPADAFVLLVNAHRALESERRTILLDVVEVQVLLREWCTIKERSAGNPFVRGHLRVSLLDSRNQAVTR